MYTNKSCLVDRQESDEADSLSPLYGLYYAIKPAIPRYLQIFIRRKIVLHKRAKYGHIWPIDESAGEPPSNWTGWPDNKKFAFVLMHDVDTQNGHDKCRYLMDLEEELGFRSTFNFVPERYKISESLLDEIKARGFGLGVHGLKHDGKLFASRKIFLERAKRINEYLSAWGTRGFSSPAMLHNLQWMDDLDIDYGTSTFDTDPFEPQPDGIKEIIPFWVQGNGNGKGYLELPYTMPQDFTLFILMKEKNAQVWKKKLKWIAGKGGMALLNTHPDYMNYNGGKSQREEYDAKFYSDFLKSVKAEYGADYWHVLPSQVAEFFRPQLQKPRNIALFKQKQNMKICMVAYTFYETDNRVRRYAETLANEGCRVDVIALRRFIDQPKEECIKNVNVYRIQDRIINEKGKLSYLRRLLRFFFASAYFLSKRHLCGRYDLIHVHSVPDFEVFAAMIPKILGARIILDIHDIMPEFYSSKFKTSKKSLIYKSLMLIERLSSAFSDHVVISNHIWEKRLIDRSVKADKCTTIMNYPDEFIFENCQTKNNGEKVVLLYPGTLNYHQGLDIAVEAFARIKDRAPQAVFHIYGEGPGRPLIEEIIKLYHLEKRVLLKGMVPIDEIVKQIACADLGIVPKRNDPFGGEAFSTKTLEFMQLGVPIILSRTKIDDFYFNESIVKFFAPEDPDDLAMAMLELIENEQYRKQLAANALKFVSNYRWGAKKEIYLDLVHDLLSAPVVQKRNLGMIQNWFTLNHHVEQTLGTKR